MTSQPAIKLLDFFSFSAMTDTAIRQVESPDSEEAGGLTKLSTIKAQTISECMRSLPSIGREDAQRWVKYWKGVGFI